MVVVHIFVIYYDTVDDDGRKRKHRLRTGMSDELLRDSAIPPNEILKDIVKEEILGTDEVLTGKPTIIHSEWKAMDGLGKEVDAG